MTVQNTPVINKWTGNGTNTEFDFDFRIDSASQLRVSLLSDYDNPLVLGTDYSIKDISEGGSYPLAGGTIIYPLSGSSHSTLTSEDKIVLELNISYVQNVPFSQGGITASAIEECLDYNVRLMQRLKQDNIGYKENIELSVDNFKTTVNGQISSIQTSVNTANTNASAAVSTANTASANASNAVSTANTASTNASNAVSTANTANTNASNAVSTANSAVSTANGAVSTANTASGKVDAFGESISSVLEAASKINQLEESVTTATNAATTATNKASEATTAAQTATQKAQEAQEAAESIVIPTTLSSFIDDLGSNPEHTHNQYITDVSDKANKDLSNLSDDGEAKLNRSLRNIGEVVISSIPLNDAGLHELDGALLQYGSYKAFIDRMATIYSTTPSRFCTEAQWQASVNNYGVCDKFVYNSTNKTVRLPKWGTQIYTTKNIGDGTLPVKGNGRTMGITDGTTVHSLCNYTSGSTTYLNYSNSVDQPVSSGGGSIASPFYTTMSKLGLSTDSSTSGVIADLSTFTNYSLDCYYYIVIANTTKTPTQVNIDEVMTDLNGKADIDLSNVPSSKGILVDTYINGDSGYRIYSDGLKEQWGHMASGVNAPKTVTLLKPYSSTYYNVIITTEIVATQSGTCAMFSIISKTTTSMSIGASGYGNGNIKGFYWIARGY